MAYTREQQAKAREDIKALGFQNVPQFQRYSGLKPDGIIGPKTWDALYPDHNSLPVFRDLPDPQPNIAYPASKWPFEKDCQRFYGAPGSGQVTLQLPYRMRLAWDLRKAVEKFSCHAQVKTSLEQIFEQVKNAYDETSRRDLGLDLFGGCLNVRRKRGGSSWSMHAWGIAVDLDPARNDLHSTRKSTYTANGRLHRHARMSDPEYETYWRIVESTGAISLGRARDYDWMHFQFARL